MTDYVTELAERLVLGDQVLEQNCEALLTGEPVPHTREFSRVFQAIFTRTGQLPFAVASVAVALAERGGYMRPRENAFVRELREALWGPGPDRDPDSGIRARIVREVAELKKRTRPDYGWEQEPEA